MILQDFKEAMQRCDKTRRQLCEEAGVPYSTVNKWLYGGVHPTVENMEKLLIAAGYRLTIMRINLRNDASSVKGERE